MLVRVRRIGLVGPQAHKVGVCASPVATRGPREWDVEWAFDLEPALTHIQCVKAPAPTHIKCMCEEIESTAVECGDRCDHCARVLTALPGRCAPCMQQLGVDIKLMGQRAAAVVARCCMECCCGRHWCATVKGALTLALPMLCSSLGYRLQLLDCWGQATNL
jgi:hypothetical protein